MTFAEKRKWAFRKTRKIDMNCLFGGRERLLTENMITLLIQRPNKVELGVEKWKRTYGTENGKQMKIRENIEKEKTNEKGTT